MIRSPLPLAPRPHAGEAISSWVGRMAARYDITGEHLGRFVADRQLSRLGAVIDLDHRANPVLEGALASVARVERANISKLRIVRDDGSASCWHRDAPVWCLCCVRDDLARHGEVYGRSVWRLGCCVLCPVHDLLLDHLCRRCGAEARCQHRPVDGRLLLACKACERPIKPGGAVDRRAKHLEGAFGIAVTPPLIGLVRRLQRDLASGLAESSPACAWGPVRSSATLMTVTSALTVAVIWSAGFRVEPRVDFSAIARGQAGTAVHEPITLALLAPYVAFGLMALIAIFLTGLLVESAEHYEWRPDGFRQPLNAATFLAWLNERERTFLHRAAPSWGSEACDAARRAIDAVTSVQSRPGRRSLAPDVRGDLG